MSTKKALVISNFNQKFLAIYQAITFDSQVLSIYDVNNLPCARILAVTLSCCSSSGGGLMWFFPFGSSLFQLFCHHMCIYYKFMWWMVLKHSLSTAHAKNIVSVQTCNFVVQSNRQLGITLASAEKNSLVQHLIYTSYSSTFRIYNHSYWQLWENPTQFWIYKADLHQDASG